MSEQEMTPMQKKYDELSKILATTHPANREQVIEEWCHANGIKTTKELKREQLERDRERGYVP